MKDTPRDYTKLTEIAKSLGMMPHKNRWGMVEAGKYTLYNFHAPIDLSACAEDEKSILKTALRQLSERADNAYNDAIERDLAE